LPAAAPTSWAYPRTFGPGDVHGDLREFKLSATAEGYFFSSRGLRKKFSKYYFNNPRRVTHPKSSRASCLGMVSLGANSLVAAAASYLCLSSGYDGAHILHPLAWPTHPLRFPASPQRAGWWSPWTPEKEQMNNPFYYSLTRRSRVQVLPARARNSDIWDRRRIVNNMR
jgi:hypothetical protein